MLTSVPYLRKLTETRLTTTDLLASRAKYVKIFEEVIPDAFVHLESKCLIRDSQHGFRKGYSCLTNLLTFTLTFSTVRIMDSTVDKDALETGDWRALLVNKVVHYRL